MIRKLENKVEITVYHEDILKSIAWMEDLKEFMEGKGAPDTTTIQTAIETMSAFVCEHFGDEFDNAENTDC